MTRLLNPLAGREARKGPGDLMPSKFEEMRHLASANDGQIRAAIYTRFSSELQRKASTEDQRRNCQEAADRNGWLVLDEHVFSDEQKSGTTIRGRTGVQALTALAKTKPKPFDYILIDDTSRLGRNVPDVFKLVDILNYNQIHIYFVSDQLDSKQEWFRDLFIMKARQDENYSKQLSQKVTRGRMGRFLAGFNPGGGCYGYNNIGIPDLSRKGSLSKPALIGVKQVINLEQAAVVVEIFASYAKGLTDLGIAKALNARGVLPSQPPRNKSQSTWSKSAIQEILKNGRYIGKLNWGTTTQVQDPETGKKQRRPVPEELWETRDAPELRIISDELWAEVTALRLLKVSKMGIQRTGGMNRTDQSRRYLFSGLLRCGLCGGNMVVISNNPARYGCSTHSNRGLCDHSTTIRLEDLERTFLTAIGEKLRSSDLREELVQALHFRLQVLMKQRLVDEIQVANNRTELEDNRRTLLRNQENILKAIREGCSSRALYEDLTQIEGRIGRINESLAAGSKAPQRSIGVEEVRTYIREQAHRFEELLMASPEILKLEFQRRITEIILTPRFEECGPVYRVAGDVALFSAPEGMLQTNQVHLIGLQRTISIDFEVVAYRRRWKWASALAG